MEVISLQSGSSGNCVYVETADVRLLFDAGISGKQAQQRLAQFEKDIRDVDALIISHDHGDHTRHMGVLQRKFGLPIYITRPTLDAATRHRKIGPLSDVTFFESGDTLWFDEVSIETMSTPHDAADGVVFVVEDDRHRFGVLTDLGHVFEELEHLMGTLDAAIVESNYEPSMLDDCDYPDFLKHRIRGPAGHISNVEAGELLLRAGMTRMQWACLAHLSNESNHPEVALQTCRRIIGTQLSLRCADRGKASELMRL